MALFGAPLAHEDHAVRACYAALRMQESVKRHAGEMRRTTGVPLAIRVGLNSGEVVVRSIGSDLRMDYTAVGQTAHLAARMEQAALPGSVVLTPDTLRLAEGFVEVRPLGAMPVKGMAGPVEVYELTGAGPAPIPGSRGAWPHALRRPRRRSCPAAPRAGPRSCRARAGRGDRGRGGGGQVAPVL
jgi:class 3 adenylate cyclase